MKISKYILLVFALSAFLYCQEDDVSSDVQLDNVSLETTLESSSPASDTEDISSTDTTVDTTEEVEEVENIIGEDEVEESENSISAVESFFNNAGFAIFPRSRTFNIRSFLSVGLTYESDPFLDGTNQEDISVFTTLGTSFSKQYGRLGFSLRGQVRYVNRILEEDLSDILPTVSTNLNYQGKRFKWAISQSFSRSDNFFALDQGQNDIVHTSNTSIGVSTNYQRFLFEINTFYSYRKSFELDDEDHNFGQSFFVGYPLFRGWLLTFDYSWNYIVDEIDNSLAHSISIGVSIPIEKNLSGRVSIGGQYREDSFFLIFNGNLNWRYSSRLSMNLSLSGNTSSAFDNEFQYNINSNFGFRYVFSPRIALSNNIRFLYSIFENGNTDYGFSDIISATYRLKNGIDLDLSYEVEYRDSEQNEDFLNHQINFGLTIVF